jgi:hypothetical protein
MGMEVNLTCIGISTFSLSLSVWPGPLVGIGNTIPKNNSNFFGLDTV